MSDFDAIVAGLGEERWIRLRYAAAYRWRKPDGEVVVIDPEEIEIVVVGEPKLDERTRAFKVVEAAEAHAGALRLVAELRGYDTLTPTSRVLLAAVDEFHRTAPAA